MRFFKTTIKEKRKFKTVFRESFTFCLEILTKVQTSSLDNRYLPKEQNAVILIKKKCKNVGEAHGKRNLVEDLAISFGRISQKPTKSGIFYL
jgi:hypothetical protein